MTTPTGNMAGSPAPTPHEPPSTVPPGARRQVAHYLGVVAATEAELRDALILVAGRHQTNYEIARGSSVLAVWSAEHLDRIETMRAAYGHVDSEAARLLRAALLGGAQFGVVGELDDACDLAVLVQRAEMTWTILVQGAKELHDDQLLEVASKARDQSRRQLAWLRTLVEHEAPDAIAVVPDQPGQQAGSLPKRPPPPSPSPRSPS